LIHRRGIDGRHRNRPLRYREVDNEEERAMNNVLAQQSWKEALAVGVVTAVLGGMVLGPGPSILISVTLFDVCLLGLV
jgi:hypothetical protein